jgi:hypothetical protein
MENKILRKKIKEQFSSQVAFAFHLGEHDSLVSKVVRGWITLPPDKQKKWAKALEARPEELFNNVS